MSQFVISQTFVSAAKSLTQVVLSKTKNILILRLDSNEENRVTAELCEDILAALDIVESVPNACALITVGTGKFFSNGIFVEKSRENAKELARVSDLLYQVLARILVFPLPTIAAINGHAFGAGAMLSFAHDFRVMNNEAGWLCVPVSDIGLILPSPLISLVQAKVPTRSQRPLILQGTRFGADLAKKYKLVDFAVPQFQLLAKATEIAVSMSSKGKDRVTYGGLKTQLYKDTVALLSAASSEKLSFQAKL
eukprot:TRINITY_DN13020_c0_g1_i1.p1 TRINITY_DN13020_c0_g1~~TRINITY_DN13020_c0_g1_i1.p1  ORF type:complete len:262 (+),score=48.78 TRINITY_DN13020_c0_g1_i1:34-786(+)